VRCLARARARAARARGSRHGHRAKSSAPPRLCGGGAAGRGPGAALRRARACGHGRGSAMTPTGELLVVVPTYNEYDNLAGLIDRIRVAVPAADILVVDDASPD